MNPRLFAIIFIFLIICSAVTGQELTVLGMEQGLSNSTVTCIYKDHFGFMWFGTFDGLNRYDGYSFRKFRSQTGDSTSLPDNYINAIEESPDHKLYVGTKRGLAYWNYHSSSFSYVQFVAAGATTGRPAYINNPVTSVRSDRNNNVYLGTTGLGLMVIRNGSAPARPIPLNKTYAYSVSAIATDRDMNVWFLSPDFGLCFYQPGTAGARVVDAGFGSGNCLKVDSAGNLWIGTNAGLYRRQAGAGAVKRYEAEGLDLSESRVMDITFEKNRFLWISTDGDGLPVIDIISGKHLQTLKHRDSGSLASNSLYTVFIDGEARKWIGTMRGGINVIDSRKSIFTTHSHEPYNANSLIHNTVFSFCEDGDNIWIGTDGGGLSIWNRNRNSFRPLVFSNTDRKQHGSNQITSILKDKNGDILLASYGAGVKRFNRQAGTFEDIPFLQSDKGAKYVLRLFRDAEDNIWAGCIRGRYAGKLPTGLFLFNREQNRFEPASYLLDEEVLSITDDRKGNLWVGTLKNLIRINKRSSAVKKFAVDSYVRGLYTDSQGRLWIGTSGRGLLLFDSQAGKFRDFSEENGLANNVVVSIEEDDRGCLWLGTFNGLSRLNLKTLKFENFYASDGLQSNQFYYNASCKLRSGEILFGGIKGFNVFNPNRIRTYSGFPRLLITGINVLNRPVTEQSGVLEKGSSLYQPGHIVLPFEKSMFSLDYVALEYSFPGKIQYAFYLKGWDKSWNYSNNLRNISYSRLNEGTYTLLIRSTNASGIWNPKPMQIRVTVLPPWYRSWWAYLAYLLLLGAAIYLYVYYQKEKARLQFEVKLASLRAAQEEELNEKKISFFTNIAHELRTPLTLIVNPVEDLLNNDGKNINLVDVSSVHRNARRLLSLVDQLLLFKSTENEISDLRPEVLDLGEVCNEVFLCFKNQVKKRGLSYRFDNFSEGLKVFADREKIEIVLFNLLSNAIKYTTDGGTVLLVLSQSGEQVELMVKNTGPVIPPDVGEQLFDKFYRLEQGAVSAKRSGFGIGLFVSKKIAEKQKGSLNYSSSEENGTVFTYVFPKNTAEIDLNALETTAGNTALLGELFSEVPEMESDPGKGTVSENMQNVFAGVVERKPNVLVVDDDAEMRSYIVQLLKQNYNTFEAQSGEQGLEFLTKAEPDIIVSDVVMGGMSGIDFCSRVKESREYGHVPVILLTASSSTEVKLKGVECGADDYITKPFEKELFLARIRSILKGRDSLKKYFFNEVTLQNNSEKVSEEYRSFLNKCIEIIELHLKDEQFGVKQFATEIGMSHSNLYRKVKAISGLSINEFIRYIRLKKAAELLIRSDLQIKEVSFKVGFQDARYFREQFNKVFGSTPSEYIRKYRRTFLRAPGT